MSGHSKWSKIKHQKGATDVVRGKIFTKCTKAIAIAVKGSGITDPDSNFKLRLAIEKARSLNMPKETIERAIEKAKGQSEGEALDEVIYEGFGPEGIGIILEVATNNKQRTVSEIKNILERGGGSLATSGAVTHFFQYVGHISVSKSGKSFDEIMEIAINCGAIDLEDGGETIEIYTNPADLHKIKEKLISEGLEVISIDLIYKPLVTVPIKDKGKAKTVMDLLTALDEAEDVQKSFANFEIPDEYLN